MTKATIFASLVLAIAACRMDARQQVAQKDSSTAGHVDAQQVVAEPDTSAARVFVRTFYDWYVPKVLAKSGSFDVALEERPTVFSDSLRRALVVDSLAQSRAVGEIDGIDWDPYLNSQDPCDRYEVGAVSHLDDSTDAVEVFAICGGRRDTLPSVIATVRTHAQEHHFIDFRAPGDSLGLIDHIWLLHPRKGARR